MADDISSRIFTKSTKTQSPGPPLIGALLRMPWETVRQRMLERLHERGFDDLDARQVTVLLYPGPQDMRPSDLAARLRMSKQALNYLLGELEGRGYITRGPDPEDMRSRRIAMTPRGDSALQAIREAVTDTEREWARELGPKRFDELRALLLELNELS